MRAVPLTVPTESLEETLKEIFQKSIEYYLQKTQNVHKPHPGNLRHYYNHKSLVTKRVSKKQQRRASESVSHNYLGAILDYYNPPQQAL